MKPSLFTAAALSLALALPAVATNTHFATGDLLLTFQKVGSTNTVYADLGSASSFRGATAGTYASNKLNIVDLNATLTSAFGASWASDPNVYVGAAGVYNVSSTSSVVVNGDASRTLYVSAARNAVGSVGSSNSSAPTVGSNTDMTGAAAAILTQNNIFGDVGTSFPTGYDAQLIISPTSVSQIDDKQPVTTFNGSNFQGTAFGVFGGGIQQQGDASAFGNFGSAGTVEFALDLYRIVAVNGKANEIDGTLRTGDFQGTITINSSGKVSFVAGIAASTATPFESWIAGYTTITATADKASAADPDGDGLSNLTEFVLGGNPSVSNPSAGPAAVISGNNLAVSFTRSAASVGNTTAVVQYSTDLSTWLATDVTTPTTSGAQTVNVPTSKASNGKLFTRLKVTQP
ncbi:MAG: hypothetical protein ORN51_10695 [Akkermansiaceae bacterium]|nr:hypothetical protein [Akkermansiaceae bacterium]